MTPAATAPDPRARPSSRTCPCRTRCSAPSGCCASWCCSTPSASTCVRYDDYDHPLVGLAGDGPPRRVDRLRRLGVRRAGPSYARAAGRRPGRGGRGDRRLAVRQGRGAERDPARLLGDGRRARVGDRVALGGRPRGRRGGLDRRHQHPRRTSPRRSTATSSCSSSAARSSASSPGCCSRWPASATGPSAPPPPRPSASGWPAWCTTACCRCSRWCSGAAPELGPDGRELGRLAGEQEVRLRGLVQQDSRDLVAPLGRPRPRAACWPGCRARSVHVAVPGHARRCCRPSGPARCSPRWSRA